MPTPVISGNRVGSRMVARFGAFRFGTTRFGFVPRDVAVYAGNVDKLYRHQPFTEELEAAVTHTVVQTP